MRNPIQRLFRGAAHQLRGDLANRLSRIEAKIDRLERLTHGGQAVYVGNNRVLTRVIVGGHYFGFLLEGDDRLLMPWLFVTGKFETPVTNFFLNEVRPDSHGIDVGANFGYFTCLMARLTPQGRVIGVEADRHVYELVRDNLAINGLAEHATAMHLAAADQHGVLTLHRRPTRSANTSIIAYDEAFSTHMGETPAQTFTVNSAPMDSLLETMGGRVDFLKVDVEGAEPLVFAGAQQIIASNPNLKVMMEWSPGQIQTAGFDLRTFLDELQAAGLSIFDLDEDRQTLLSIDELLNIPYRAGVVLRRR